MKLEIYDFDYYEKDNAAKTIIEDIKSKVNNITGLWLYREPELKTDGNDLPTYTILSQQLGLVFIKVYDFSDNDINSIEKKYWTIKGKKVRSEFIRFQNYVHKVNSRIQDPINDFENEISVRVFYVFPYVNSFNIFQNYITKENETILYGENINFDFSNENLSETDYNLLVSIVQNANIINNLSNTYVDEPAQNMQEAIVLNEQKISQFDREQMKASNTITDKSERIRGLAGSGKTVLLAMKAARLHKRYPNKKIAFVFYTKSLYNQATSLIRKYYNLIAESEPNWDNLRVLHSWGGNTTGEGFYSYICKEIGIAPSRYSTNTSFNDVCNDLLKNHQLKEVFDYILVDEAQDFPLSFFLLVERVLRQPKKVVIAYDELQTTNDIRIPEFSELFGSKNGKSNIELDESHDYILRKSYRNTREVLVTAFAFGFGFYDDLTQIIQDNLTWNALGFEVEGEFAEGNTITVHRPKENSPNSVLNYYNYEKPVQAFTNANYDVTVQEIVNKITYLINEQHIDPKQILVIDLKMNKTKTLNNIQFGLFEKHIKSHIPGVVTDARDFFQDGYVTLSTPRNSKGNEVPVVIIVGCEDIYEKKKISDKRQSRNFMFISMTRSKGWVFLYASGRVKTRFSNELQKIQKNMPNILFSYPSQNTVNEISKINYLIDNPAAKQIDLDIDKFKRTIEQADAETLKILIDLNPDFKSKLQSLLNE